MSILSDMFRYAASGGRGASTFRTVRQQARRQWAAGRGSRSRFMSSMVGMSGREGGNTFTPGRILRSLNTAGRLSGSKKFMVPFMAGAFGIGFAQGFGQEVYNDPMTKAWTTTAIRTAISPKLQASGYDQYGNPNYEEIYESSFPGNLGRPLGYYSRSRNYNVTGSPYYTPSTSDPLMATGELMLATFATRHGR